MYIFYTTNMIYFAHRGANTLAPANSIAAFQTARGQGATQYELDVHLTRDGRLVVRHDYTLGNTTRPLSEFTYAQLQEFCAQQKIPCPPLLEEIFPQVRPALALLNIEIKNDDNVYPGIEQVLLTCLAAHAKDLSDKILISSFDYPTLQRVRDLDAHIKIGLLTRAFDPQQPRALQAYSVHMKHTRITPEIIQTCHAEGRNVFVYTVNDTVLARQLEDMGVDGIFTDDITLF